MTREDLSKKYMRGNGMEVGALHNPWPLVNDALVSYVDRYTRDELIRQYPELPAEKIVETDVVADGFSGQLVISVAQGMDFICASHALEHAEDAIGVLQSWCNVLKKGGYVFLAIPEKTFTFDRRRTITTMDHFIAEFWDKKYRESNRIHHFYDFHRNKDGIGHKPLFGKDLDAAVSADMESGTHTHFHVWTAASLLEFFHTVSNLYGFFTLEEFHHEGAECLAVLKSSY